MSFLAWFTVKKLDEIEKRLRDGMASADFQMGSPAAVLEVSQCVLELIEALRKEPGPTINHQM